MDKREFLKASGAVVASAMLPKIGLTQEHAAPRTNWSGNYTYSTDKLDQLTNAAEVQKIIRGHGPIKALGARHSFNGIADSTGEQISLKALDSMELDTKTHTVTVGAGVTYGHLAPYLHEQGYAVHNLASLPHVSVVGACMTGTHGSGSRNGNLSTAVRAFEMVKPDGETIVLSHEKHPEFMGAVVALGALGVVTKITLAVQPTFQVRQMVYQNMSMDVLEKHLEEIFASAYSVSLFTDWQNHRISQVWLKHRVTPGETYEFPTEFHGAKMATTKLHPLDGHPAESCTEQMGVPGPWHERLPHFKMNFTPSSGQELQTEYFVPRERAYEAILAVETLWDMITPHLFVTELRTIDADELWISECYRRPSMAIHFTWKPEWEDVKKILPLIEAKLVPFDARPHWAKLFTMEPAKVRASYPKMSEFRALLKRYDPQGKLRNAYLDKNIYV